MYRNVMLALALVAGSSTAQAATVVDTGANPAGSTWSVNWGQSIAGSFTIGSQTTISGVEGFIGSFTAGYTMTVGIFDANGSAPGKRLYSYDFTAATADAWQGATGQAWTLGAGSYWVVFSSTRAPSIYIRGRAPTPLAAYSYIDPRTMTAWRSNDSLAASVRVTSVDAIAAVPEPSNWALMVLGSGMVGGALRRRRVKLRRIVI